MAEYHIPLPRCTG